MRVPVIPPVCEWWKCVYEGAVLAKSCAVGTVCTASTVGATSRVVSNNGLNPSVYRVTRSMTLISRGVSAASETLPNWYSNSERVKFPVGTNLIRLPSRS